MKPDPSLGRPPANAFIDPALWSRVEPRADDIVVATCYRSGTTLTQQMLNLMLFGERDFSSIRHISPWIDSALFCPDAPTIEALPSRRFFKSHLPFDALPRSPGWRYIYLVRDGRDVALSLFRHCKSLQAAMPTDDEGRPLEHGPDDVSAFFDAWVETGSPRWDWWHNVASWWAVRHRPDVLLMHFADLVADKAKAVRIMARFLGIEWTPALDERVRRGSSLERMKALERAGRFGAQRPRDKAVFIGKGTNGHWRDVLSSAQVLRYLELRRERLDPECARWTAEGGWLPSVLARLEV